MKRGIFRKCHWHYHFLSQDRMNSLCGFSYAKRFHDAADGLSNETVEDVDRSWMQEVIDDECAKAGITSQKTKRRLLKALFSYYY